MAETNIPSSISLEKLQALAEDAHVEADTEKHTYSGMNACDSIEMRKAYVDTITDKMSELDGIFKDPMIMKLAILYATQMLFQWHNNRGLKLAEQADAKGAGGWFRDAGLLQAIEELITSIDMGENDWMTGVE